MRENWRRFEVMPAELGIEECGKQAFFPYQSYDYHAYQTYVIHYVESGYGQLKVDGETYELGPNDGFIVQTGKKFHYQGDGQDPWFYYWVGLYGSELITYLKRTSLEDSPKIVFPVESSSAQQIKYICEESFLVDPVQEKSDLWYRSQAYALMDCLVQEFTAPHYELIQTERPAVEVAHHYIFTNYMDPISITELAEYLGMSRQHLYRLFKEEYGLSPQELIREKRLFVARQLLEETHHTIGDIAQKVGYHDQLSFSKMFRHHEGMSPSQYRKQTRE